MQKLLLTAVAVFEGAAPYRRSQLQAGSVVCRERRSGAGTTEWTHAPEFVLPRRGVFCVHHAHEQMIADVNTALLFGEGLEYRVSHPTDEGTSAWC